MARNGTDALVKRNSKLEAFLKRNLDEDTFERIRAHEACIVCSKKEDKAFKFVVISDEWVYLTENPPKKITEEVHLGNVTSIQLVNDFPDFLSGEERTNTQHILIKYMSNDPPKGKAKKNSVKEGSTSPHAVNGNLTYRGSLSARSIKRHTWERKTQSLKETMTTKREDIPARRRCSLDADMLREVMENEEPNTRKNSKKKKRKNKGGRRDSVMSKEEETLSTTSQGRQLPRLLPTVTGDSYENSQKLSQTHTGELRLALEKLEEQEDVNEETGNKAQLTSRTEKNNNDLSKSDSRLSFFRKKRDANQTTQDKEGSGENIEEEEEEEWHQEDLHLYILNIESSLLMLTRASWNNYLIRETMEQDQEYFERTTGFLEPKLSASAGIGKYEKFSLLFAQLKTELLHEESNIEDMFSLVNELKSAAERNFALKKLFWRTPDVFLFFIKQLKMYLPNSPSKLFAECEEDKSDRADEIEFVILLLETLALMFRETEILPYRVSCLSSGQGRAVRELVELLVVQPQLLDLELPKPPPLSLSLSLNKTSIPQNNWDSEADLELYTLAGEFNAAATVVLSELILIAQQADWKGNTNNFLNLCWLVNTLDKQPNVELFLEQLVVQALQLVSPTNIDELLPTEAVRLFHQFSVLETMIRYSPTSADFIREHFYEEFKYFVQGPVVHAKLPKHFPVADTTKGLIEKVMSNVLGKVVNLTLNNVLN